MDINASHIYVSPPHVGSVSVSSAPPFQPEALGSERYHWKTGINKHANLTGIKPEESSENQIKSYILLFISFIFTAIKLSHLHFHFAMKRKHLMMLPKDWKHY